MGTGTTDVPTGVPTAVWGQAPLVHKYQSLFHVKQFLPLLSLPYLTEPEEMSDSPFNLSLLIRIFVMGTGTTDVPTNVTTGVPTAVWGQAPLVHQDRLLSL